MTVAPAAEQDSLVAAEPDRYYSLVITGLVEGRAALVSGAGSGIGRATARLLATYGARVASVDINAAAAEQTAEDIRQAGGQAIALPGDASNDTQVHTIVATATEASGRAGPPGQPCRHRRRRARLSRRAQPRTLGRDAARQLPWLPAYVPRGAGVARQRPWRGGQQRLVNCHLQRPWLVILPE
jgi:NAD(P)-dependent dehydrogenase (short-subunit alcohol dehydrogenase family)